MRKLILDLSSEEWNKVLEWQKSFDNSIERLYHIVFLDLNKTNNDGDKIYSVVIQTDHKERLVLIKECII